MTNRCRATPNTSPDSPSNVESRWRVWHCSTPICHKVLGVMGAESTLAPLWRHMHSIGRRNLASNAFRRLVHLVFYAAKSFGRTLTIARPHGLRIKTQYPLWPRDILLPYPPSGILRFCPSVMWSCYIIISGQGKNVECVNDYMYLGVTLDEYGALRWAWKLLSQIMPTTV